MSKIDKITKIINLLKKYKIDIDDIKINDDFTVTNIQYNKKIDILNMEYFINKLVRDSGDLTKKDIIINHNLTITVTSYIRIKDFDFEELPIQFDETYGGEIENCPNLKTLRGLGCAVLGGHVFINNCPKITGDVIADWADNELLDYQKRDNHRHVVIHLDDEDERPWEWVARYKYHGNY